MYWKILFKFIDNIENIISSFFFSYGILIDSCVISDTDGAIVPQSSIAWYCTEQTLCHDVPA